VNDPLARTDFFAWFLALSCALAPLWASQALPLVDLPQHLHLISVLHRLDDPSTLYPEIFARRPELTPYLGYYYAVSLLNWLFPSNSPPGLPLGVRNRPAALARLLAQEPQAAHLARPVATALRLRGQLRLGLHQLLRPAPAVLTGGLFVRAIRTRLAASGPPFGGRPRAGAALPRAGLRLARGGPARALARRAPEGRRGGPAAGAPGRPRGAALHLLGGPGWVSPRRSLPASRGAAGGRCCQPRTWGGSRSRRTSPSW
jgi:hypothetical protein